MKNDTPSLPFRQSETIVDPLSELAREGARRMLADLHHTVQELFGTVDHSKKLVILDKSPCNY
jgi:hypothetical protein